MTVAGTTVRRQIAAASLILLGTIFLVAIQPAVAQTTNTTSTNTTATSTNTTSTTTTSTTTPTQNIIINNSGAGFVGPNLVGGVSVSVEGVLKSQDASQRDEVLKARRKALQTVSHDLNQVDKLRMVSLRKLDGAIAHYAQTGQPLPDVVRYLAGLQRVQYVFVYPDQHDVVLAGPAEGWMVNGQGDVVGNVSGRPVLQLEDLLVALRCADQARSTGGMSCSIDPSPEGMQRVNALLSQTANANAGIEKIAGGIEEAAGPQKITLHGMPESSRFANVLVAADYQMKRLGMNFDPSPVKGLTSYLEMVSPTAHAIQTPRWWLAPKYEPLATDGEGLAWEIRGPGVQCMAEEDFFNSNGQRQSNNKASPAAQRWADSMSQHYEELAQKDGVFGDLRNCMDLAVAGALIQKENLFEKVGLHLQFLLDAQRLVLTSYNTPRTVDSKVSFLKKGKNYVIAVSGGVAIQPWEIIQKPEVTSTIGPVRAAVAKALSTTTETHANQWWWNG